MKKKRIKEMGFFNKICYKFVMMNNRKADRFFVFLLESLSHCFHFDIYPNRLLIVKNFGFMGNEFVMILRIVTLKIKICLFTPFLEKLHSQLNWDLDGWIRSLFES